MTEPSSSGAAASWPQGRSCPCRRSHSIGNATGTRHRAAIGVTEQTDAVVIVVSEETGSIGLVQRGRLLRDLDEERLRTALVALLGPSGGAGRAAAGISALGAPFVRGKRPRVPRRRRTRASEGTAGQTSPVAADTAPAAAPPTVAPVDGGAGARSARRGHHARCPGCGRVTVRRWSGVRRLLDFVLRNWPLKLAAIGLATVLYAGVTLSGNEHTWPGAVPIEVLDPPPGAAVLDLPGSVTSIRYRAPIEASSQLTNGSFLASIDLGNVTPTAGGPPVPVNVRVTAIDPRVQVIDFTPRSVNVRVDQVVSRPMSVTVDRGTVPDGLTLGAPQVSPATVLVRGASSRVAAVQSVVARVAVDASGLNVDQDVDLEATDETGAPVPGCGAHPATGARAHRRRPRARLRHPAGRAGPQRGAGTRISREQRPCRPPDPDRQR